MSEIENEFKNIVKQGDEFSKFTYRVDKYLDELINIEIQNLNKKPTFKWVFFISKFVEDLSLMLDQ
jgi:hypothetical protein